MILRDLTDRQWNDMKKRCMKEYTTYIMHSFGREDKEDVWKKAFSHGIKAGMDIAPHVDVRDWKAVRKIVKNKS